MARTVPVHAGYTILNGVATGSNGGRIDVWVEYKLGDQDLTTACTPIIAYFYAALNPGYTSAAQGDGGLNSSFAVNGNLGSGVEDGAYDFTDPEKYNLLGLYRGEIPHDEEGLATATFAGAFTTLSSSVSGGSISASITLPPIIQAVKVSAVDAVLGAKCRLQWTPEFLYDSFTVIFSLGEWSHTTTKIYPNTTGRYTYTGAVLPLTAAQFFKTRTATMRATLMTYRNEVLVGSSTTEFTVSVPENQQTCPVVNVRLVPICTPFSGIYVQRLGKVRAVGGATDPYKADITDLRLFVDGVAVEGMLSDFLEKSGTLPVRVEATNSRGFVGIWEGEISVYPYDCPRLQGTACRCLNDGTADPGGRHLYLGGAYQLYALGGQNTGLLQWRVKESGGSYCDWKTLSEKQYGELVTEALLEREKAYQVQLRVIDLAGSTAELTFAIPAEQIYMHRTANGLGLGGYVETENTLALHWDVLAHKAINGAYIRTLTVPDTSVTLTLTGTVLVIGGGVLGILTATEAGATWSGTAGVTAVSKDTGVTLTLPRAGSRLLLLSPEIIEI